MVTLFVVSSNLYFSYLDIFIQNNVYSMEFRNGKNTNSDTISTSVTLKLRKQVLKARDFLVFLAHPIQIQ